MQSFERLANELGLVPMQFVVGWYVPYGEGDVAGFPPDVAQRLYEEDEAAVPYVDGGPIMALPAPKVPAEASVNEPVAVEISPDWESLHHLSRIRLAKELSGSSPATAEQADSIIRAELQRRGGTNANEV